MFGVFSSIFVSHRVTINSEVAHLWYFRESKLNIAMLHHLFVFYRLRVGHRCPLETNSALYDLAEPKFVPIKWRTPVTYIVQRRNLLSLARKSVTECSRSHYIIPDGNEPPEGASC